MQYVMYLPPKNDDGEPGCGLITTFMIIVLLFMAAAMGGC